MLLLPEGLREEARKPFGSVVRGETLLWEYRNAKRPLITVGDQCFLDALEAGYSPDIAIFDFKIRRVEIPLDMKRKFASHAANAFVVMSPAGVMTEELEIAVGKVLSAGKGTVFVVGEDDLSALLVMALAKAGTLVYGQPEEGAVVVRLGTEETEKRAKGIISRMTRA